MANKDIKDMSKEYKIKLWQVADKLGISDVTLSKMLRKELPDETKQTIRHYINDLYYDEHGEFYDNDF